MGSKVFIYLGLLLAFVLLVSSQVASADKSIDPNKEEVTSETDGVEESKYGGYNNGGGYRGGGGGYNNGGGYRGGGGGYNNGGGYRGGGGYNNGGGYRGGGGYPGRGGGGGGYCRYGCCGGSAYGRGCRRCCSYAGEAATTTTPGN